MTSAATAVLPASHVDLLDRPLAAVLTTTMPDGRLQSTVVWYERDGGDLLVNTMREFQKARNLRARPTATLLVVEPGDTTRWVEVRARVVPDDQDASAHLDALAYRYTGAARYFGEVVPAHLAAVEHPVLFRLAPTVVRTGPMYTHGPRPVSGPVARIPVRGCGTEPAIPPSHRDLLERPLAVALSTRMPSGAAQTHPVWCSLDGNDVLVNTTRQRRKGRNLAADPRATVLAVDPDDSSRWLEVRGDVDLVDDGALEHLDRLTREYTGHDHYYGTVYPVEQRGYENRVVVRVHPRHIVCDAVHRGGQRQGQPLRRRLVDR
jgi:PPOX class probable F420-dependent enzyme